MTMQTLTYQVSFNTPAFLGNAEQQAQWRTPPFKALLRQWWRVAYASSKNYQVNVTAMREAEGGLFGHAWLEHDKDTRGEKVAARKSLVRLRLGQWSNGKLKSWDGLEQQKVDHLEAEKSGYKVGPHAYLAYGPLDGRHGTKFSKKDNAAIQVGDQTTFSLAFPSEHAALIEQALVLMDLFGTAGGRSRNGWGSFSLKPQNEVVTSVVTGPTRDWKECLRLDWPHAVGQDNRCALIWQTQPHADWKALMRELAIVKIALRTQFIFPRARSDGQIHDRHWLSYPVTTHSVNEWNRNNARLPNSLRFKVRPTADGKLVGVIFHMPCLPPPAFNPNRADIERVWQKVHSFLDGQITLQRSKA